MLITSNIFGKPSHCLNGNCKDEKWNPTPLTRASFQGWMPRSGTEAYTVMQCLRCGDMFVITQMLGMVHDYVAKLPKDAAPDLLAENEQQQFRESLHAAGGNPLKSLSLSVPPQKPLLGS